MDFDNLNDNIIVHGDSVIKIKMSQETNEFMDTLYSKIRNLSELFNYYTTKKYSPVQSIDVIITKNPDLAELLRCKILDCFE